MKNFIISILVLMCLHTVNADSVLLRQNEILLNHYAASPYPTGEIRGDVVRAYTIFALKARGNTQITSADITEANSLLETIYAAYPVADETNGLYWMLPHLSRILADGQLNVYLTSAAQTSIKNILTDYVSVNDDIDYASQANMWTVLASENHDILRKQVFFTTAQVFKDNSWSLAYNDGHTVSEHYQAWGSYFESYFRERAKKGINIEVGAPTYAGVFLESIFILHDLADKNLKKRASQFLDLYFADRALVSINGVRGGAKSRCYHNHYSYNYFSDTGTSYWWVLTGQPDSLTASHTVNNGYLAVPALTSDYRINSTVADLYDTNARGSYEYITTRPGRGIGTAEPVYSVDFPSMIRWYSWCDPNFILGSEVIDENQEYTNISSQNRWYGLIAADGLNSRVYFSPDIDGGSEANTYNDYIAVQYKGTMLIRRHKDSGNYGFRMFASDTFSLSQDSGWVFGYNSTNGVYFGAFAVSGGYTISFVDEYFADWNWVTFNNPDTIVIFEAASSADFATFTDFKNAVKAKAKGQTGTRYDYTSLYDSAVLSIFTDTTLPKINGATVVLDGTNTYQSPFVNASYDSAVITITDTASNCLVIDFNEPYYLDSDVNNDGYVNLADIARLADEWGNNTAPGN